jgi:hypothetical protein
MEIVLPNGEILRSGMGALENSDMWALFKGYERFQLSYVSDKLIQRLWPKH